MAAFVPAAADTHTQSEAVQSLTGDFMSEAQQPGIGRNGGHEWVDLGLSVKWATCNVGASSPEEYGDYFAWGEIAPKSAYEIANSKTRERYFNDISGNAWYDAARAGWGDRWRLPTMEEIDELYEMCTWTWTTRNGCKGIKITGPNGNSIFLPSAGFVYGSETLATEREGSYWCSTPYDDDIWEYAYYFYFDNASYSIRWDDRRFGMSVRAVFDDSANSTVCEYIDLGLSVKWATCNVGASSPSDYGNYYAWGETSPKSKYTEDNCKTWDKNIGDIAGNRQYDVARAYLDASWRLPTKAEVQELIDKCTWTKTTLGGRNGYKVTSRINGNSIFLPAAGWRSGTSLDGESEYATFWCSAPGEVGGQNAYYLYFGNLYYGVGRIERNFGMSIRPVSE